MFVVKIRVENSTPGTPELSLRTATEGGSGRKSWKGCGMLEVMEETKWISQELGEHTGSFRARLGHRGLLSGCGGVLRRRLKV